MIFKGVREGKPYPDHGLSPREWAKIPPRQFRLDQLTTVTTVLALDKLLAEDSTFYGDLFAHIVQFEGVMYLEDGLHRAVRSALRNRTLIHARLFDLDDHLARFGSVPGADTSGLETTAPIAPVSAPLPVHPRRVRATGAHRLPD
ncbi:type II toxin-antitoxin system VapB family antitoxin [Gordonia humi]|uniref:Arc/MetJ family transcription regulator n=1 Tax=Gordonia humi TaxID=686429 RepID=A0A840EVS1_9ACTN|nr:type II toxin-antitoxin system VapB family antitoxin [Gordonia humi]MBB4137075.1 Arc/MetJ family transcription regulator [Gordonia humi]